MTEASTQAQRWWPYRVADSSGVEWTLTVPAVWASPGRPDTSSADLRPWNCTVLEWIDPDTGDRRDAGACGEKNLHTPSMTCTRDRYHEGDHGYAGVFWSRIEPPPMPINSTIFCVMAVRNGKFYAAPIGTDTTDLNATDSWLLVSSLNDLAGLLGVRP